jgi:hypothetical protein
MFVEMIYKSSFELEFVQIDCVFYLLYVNHCDQKDPVYNL